LFRFIIANFIAILLLSGCGGGTTSVDSVDSVSETVNNINPDKNDSSDINSSKTDTNEQTHIDKKPQSTDYSVLPKNDGTFDDIKLLIKRSASKGIEGVKYICVGDSTRAVSKHNGEHLFMELRRELYNYDVQTVLLARAGHTAKEFLEGTRTPTWMEVVSYIDGDGRDTIVDISLGINDYWDKDFYFIEYIKAAILKIREQKPNTHFMLTMPNRAYNDDYMTTDIQNDYYQLSRELGIPLVDVVGELMPTKEATPYSWYRDDGFYVHLSLEGQHQVARLILSKILPED
jgi:hypothetical protein